MSSENEWPNREPAGADGPMKKDQSSKRVRKKKKKVKEETVEANMGTSMKDSSSKSKRRRKKKNGGPGTKRMKKKQSTEAEKGPEKPSSAPVAEPPPPAHNSPFQFHPVVFENARDLGGFTHPFVEFGIRNLKKEFDVMQTMSKVECIQAPTTQSNKSENRYLNIQCLEATRIKSMGLSIYYNANEVDGKYIFAQSPKPETVDKFWAMVESEEVQTIIQLTPNNPKKCAPYFGGVGQPFGAGIFKILPLKHEGPDPDPNLIYNPIKFRGNGPKSIIVKHFQWKNWPEGGVPDISETMAFLYAQIKDDKKVLIHCASGSGRTAVVGMSMIMIEKSLNGGDCNMKRNLCDLRRKRHMAIRNVLQYLYVGRVVLAFLMKMNACDMSQTLLEFIDDFDTFAKKFKKDQEETRSKMCPAPEAFSELSNELIDK